jgi:SAM-dependent methyltransferase
VAHLVTLDLGLPRIDGYEVARRLRIEHGNAIEACRRVDEACYPLCQHDVRHPLPQALIRQRESVFVAEWTRQGVPVSPERVSAMRPDYGLDAPPVIRNLAIGASAGIGVFLVTVSGLWSGRVPLGPNVVLDVSWMGLSIGLTCAAVAISMVWSSKVGKLATRDRLLDEIPWKGTERVLDVGCGRGLMLIGAAKRATSGHAVGVDIWQSVDLSGNRPEATLENARREGVAERVEVKTADMKALPFADGTFDVVVSKAAIHNLHDATDRTRAIAEIARVLAPGGHAVIDDIRHVGDYEAEFQARGVTETRRVEGRFIALLLAIVTWGNLRPGALVARKPS